MTLPAKSDISVYGSLDEQHACEHFLGKSLDEAFDLFRDNALLYQEALMWMGPIAFRFYTPAFTRYLRSDDAHGDSDAVHCFVGLIELRLQHYRDDVSAIRSEIESTCEFIVMQYASFDIAESVYGDLRIPLRKISSALSAIG